MCGSPSHGGVFLISSAVIKARLAMVEKELLDEKRRRAEVESALQDVERECREPFVVPALLQAFVSISKLTTEALSSKS